MKIREAIPVNAWEILDGPVAAIINRLQELSKTYSSYEKLWLERNDDEDGVYYGEYAFIGERKETEQEEKERLEENKVAVKKAEIELMMEIAKKYDFTIMVDNNQ